MVDFWQILGLFFVALGIGIYALYYAQRAVTYSIRTAQDLNMLAGAIRQHIVEEGGDTQIADVLDEELGGVPEEEIASIPETDPKESKKKIDRKPIRNQEE